MPNTYVFTDATRDTDRKISALMRKVDVDHVKMVSANCQLALVPSAGTRPIVLRGSYSERPTPWRSWRRP